MGAVRWSVRELARAERTDLADFLAALPPDRWDAPTLCATWTVREVAAHLVGYEHLGPAGVAWRMARGRGLIHSQDIRRALGAPREIPRERLRAALPFARWAPPIGAWWRARGLRLVAPDLGWSAWRGREVRGRGEALLMAIAGRSSVAAELTGPGVAVLATRTAGW